MKGKLPLALFAVLLTILPLAGCSTGVRIGAVLSLSGEAGPYGQSTQEGIELAVEEINQAGGIQGKSISLICRDSQTSPTEGVAAIRELISRRKVLAVIGDVSSSVTLAMAPVAEQHRRVLLSPASSNPRITDAGEYIFRNYPSDVLEGSRMAAFAMDKLGIKGGLVILCIQNEYGRGLEQIFSQKFSDRGGEVTKILTYPETQTDFSQLVAEVKALDNPKPSGLYLVGYASDLAELLLELQRQGVTYPRLSVGAFDSEALLAKAGPAADGVFFPRLDYDPDSPAEPVHSFSLAYQRKYGKKPDIYAAHGYDALKIIAKVVEREGPYNAYKLQPAMANLGYYQGVSGLTSFDEKGDVRKFMRIHVVHQGRYIPYEEFEELPKPTQAAKARPSAG